MKLSTRARYAMRLMLAVSKSADHRTGPVNLKDISKLTGLPHGYLAQLAMALKNASLLKGVSGKHGGYVLARAPRDIKVGDVVEATIGPINIADCVLNSAVCMRSDYCECRLVWALINKRVNGILNDYSLADLCDDAWLSRIQRQMDEEPAPPHLRGVAANTASHSAPRKTGPTAGRARKPAARRRPRA